MSVVLLVALVSLAFSSPANAVRGRAYISNKTVLSDQGTLLRGPFIKLVNRTIYTVGSSDPSLYTPAYWKPYKDLGFNNVRIVVAWGSSYPGFSAATTMQALDELVAVFSSLDMYVTICGCANDYNWFHKADLQNQWNNLAPRYKDNPNVLYEIQNEPMGDPNGFFSNVSPPKGSAFDLVAICNSVRAMAPNTIIGMWGFSALGNSYNDALWAIQAHDQNSSISYSKTAVVFHYYPPTTPAYVASLKNVYPVWMTEGSDEGPGGTTNCDFPWYLDCEIKGISWNAMDFQNTLQKCTDIKAYLTANGHGWTNDAPAAFIVDNAGGSGVTVTGAWTSSSTTPGYNGSDYLHDGNSGKGSKSVRFTPAIPAGGSYEVFARWPAASNYASNVPIDIIHAGVTDYVEVNQRTDGGQWMSLGTYDFNAGTGGSVLVSSTGTNGYVIADAVKFLPVSGATAFVTGQTLGTLRNNYSGWVGFKFTVGSSSISVKELGRWVVPGNTGTHTVKLVVASTGANVSGGSVSVATSGAVAGQYKYVSLSSPVTLSANTAYYLMTQEASGGDQWHDYNTTVAHTSVATINKAVFSSNSSTWTGAGGVNQAYGPASFKYSLPVSSATAFVTGQTLGTLRNNYSGWVGFRFTVGSSSISVKELGRWVVSGNTGTHTVKLVVASTGANVSGGSVSVATSGAAAGQYKYVSLSSPVTLSANTAYYLVTQETSGGDQWYDFNTTVAHTSVATIDKAVWSSNSSTWTGAGGVNQAYGPASFKY